MVVIAWFTTLQDPGFPTPPDSAPHPGPAPRPSTQHPAPAVTDWLSDSRRVLYTSMIWFFSSHRVSALPLLRPFPFPFFPFPPCPITASLSTPVFCRYIYIIVFFFFSFFSFPIIYLHTYTYTYLSIYIYTYILIYTLLYLSSPWSHKGTAQLFLTSLASSLPRANTIQNNTYPEKWLPLHPNFLEHYYLYKSYIYTYISIYLHIYITTTYPIPYIPMYCTFPSLHCIYTYLSFLNFADYYYHSSYYFYNYSLREGGNEREE